MEEAHEGLVSLCHPGVMWEGKAGNPPTTGQQNPCAATPCACGLVGSEKANPASMGSAEGDTDAHLASPAWPSSTELCPWLPAGHGNDFEDGFGCELPCPFPAVTRRISCSRAASPRLLCWMLSWPGL